jgi:hypothetical protein
MDKGCVLYTSIKVVINIAANETATIEVKRAAYGFIMLKLVI